MRKLDPPVRAALRLGAYQLGFVDGVPRYAAVNESVELVRGAGLERAVAFTNAVLRRLADGIDALLDGLPDDTPANAALKHSYPDWVAETWWRDLGATARSRSCARRTSRASVVVRLVRGEIDGTPDRRFPAPGASSGSTRPRSPRVGSGRRAVRSQLVGLAVGAREGERTLDLCAAPGGKATMLAGEVVAVEVNEARARELEEAVRRLGATNVRVVVADGRALPPRARRLRPCARGRALLGARRAEPATGSPLARRAASRAPARASASGGRARRPGGTIVYSVCTINADESEAVVDASGLEVDPTLADEWPQFRHRTRPEFLQTLPHVHGTAGFFVARLRCHERRAPRIDRRG